METAKSIGESNADSALDQIGGRDYPTREASFLAHLHNTVDTAKEYGLNPEAAVLAYIAAWRKGV